MNSEKKKPSGDITPKSSVSKSMKKSTKSRVKTAKPESSSSKSSVNGQTPTSTSSTHNSTSSTPETPTTPTSSIDSSRERSHHRGYAAFGPRTIKIIWEQHDTSDIDLQPDLLPILAEDVSYKVWELAKNIKTYSMHSGGAVTSDLVNEVLKDSDCPPVLGSMDTEWDRIDYDGSYFFNADKVIELRSEYQRDVQITMPMEPSFISAWPIQGGCRDLMQAFMQSIFLITLCGSEKDFDSVRQYVYSAPFVGGCYRVLLLKVIQTLAFKQTDYVKQRCWRLLQTLVQHPCCRDIYCRNEYFHLAEIFICQLMDTRDAVPLPVFVKDEVLADDDEDVKPSSSPMEVDKVENVTEAAVEVKTEDIKPIIDEEKPSVAEEDSSKFSDTDTVKQEFVPEEESSQSEHVYRLEKDNEDEENLAEQMEGCENSLYSADMVDLELVDMLCETIGLIGATNEYFNTECMHLILRRLETFFDKRQPLEIKGEEEKRSTLSFPDYEVISRAIRGLFALGEYAFREFIPFMEKMQILDGAEDIPDSLRVEFARCAIFLRGHDDIFLYEWLKELCGYRLLPFMTHYAHHHQKLITQRHLKRRVATFRIVPKVSAKRVPMPPSKSPKKEPYSFGEVFPEREIPAKPGPAIRFKYSGCRQIPVKVKPNRNNPPAAVDVNGSKPSESPKELLIARRKLFKPLTDERRSVPLSNYHLLRI